MFLSIKSKISKRVAIIGWIGAFNLGDELMLNVTLKELVRRKHKLTLLVHDDSEKVQQRYTPHTIVKRRPLSDDAVKGVTLNNDVLFVNGGALIDDTNYDSPSSLARDIVRLARSFIEDGKKVIVYGVSTNAKLKNEKLLEDYAYILRHAEHFSVRDGYSQKILSLIEPSVEIPIVDDIVLADPIALRPLTLSLKDINSRLAIIPIYDNDTQEHLIEFLRKVTKIKNVRIRLIHFFDENNNDAVRSEEVLSRLGSERFIIDEIVSPRNSQELHHALSDIEHVVSMRYHGILFAGMMGKQVTDLRYDTHRHYKNKNTYLQEKYEYGNSRLDLSNIGKITKDELEDIVNSATISRKSVRSVHRRARKSLITAINRI